MNNPIIDWLWNFVPLGIVKFVGRHFGALGLEISIGGVGPFPVRAIGGILVRDSKQ